MTTHDLSATQAAKLLSVDKATVIRWIHTGKVQDWWKTPGGHWRIPVGEIDRIKQAGRAAANVRTEA